MDFPQILVGNPGALEGWDRYSLRFHGTASLCLTSAGTAVSFGLSQTAPGDEAGDADRICPPMQSDDRQAHRARRCMTSSHSHRP
jgi:hypothetical protein